MNRLIRYYLELIHGKRLGRGADFLRGLLWMMSGFYFCMNRIVTIIRTANRKKLPRPVISVGNLTWGGTGKTPFVQFLLSFLNERGDSMA